MSFFSRPSSWSRGAWQRTTLWYWAYDDRGLWPFEVKISRNTW